MLENEKILEQKMIIVNSDGSSRLLSGDVDSRLLKRDTNEDILPSYISLGWKVVNTTAFNKCSDILVIIQRESRH